MCTTIYLGTTTLARFVLFHAASQYLLFIAFIDDTHTHTPDRKKYRRTKKLNFFLLFTDCFDTSFAVFLIWMCWMLRRISLSRYYFGFQVGSQHLNSKMKRRAKIKANEKMAYKIFLLYIYMCCQVANK